MFGYPVIFTVVLGFIGVCRAASVSNALLPRKIVTTSGKGVELTYFVADLNPTPNVQGLVLRPKDYNLFGSKWDKTTLTYCILNYPSNGALSDAEVDAIIAKSLKYWSDASCLQFQQFCSGVSDLEVSFETGYHDGDQSPFDGSGGKLAHAFFPMDDAIGGDAHFDDSEVFTSGTYSGINLLQVATHEFGHSLGIEHSDDPYSVMKPTYTSYNSDFQLGQDDIDAIRALYGSCASVPTTTTSSTTSTTTPAQAIQQPVNLYYPSFSSFYSPYFRYFNPYYFYRYRFQ